MQIFEINEFTEKQNWFIRLLDLDIRQCYSWTYIFLGTQFKHMYIYLLEPFNKEPETLSFLVLNTYAINN